VQSFYPLTKSAQLLKFPNTGAELPMIDTLKEFLDSYQTVTMIFWLAKEDEINYMQAVRIANPHRNGFIICG
jgi:hypothetical protein